MKDDEGHLYFAAFDTYRKELYSTAISADFVNMIMSRSRSKRQVLLLDCCYSGAFAKGMIAKGADKEVHTKEHFDGHGRIILTASDAMQYSFEGDELKGVGVAEYLCKNNFQTSLFNNRINSESRFLLQAINAGSSKGSKGSSIDITIKGTSNDFAITVTAGKWGENTLLADSLYCMSGIAAAKKFSSFIFGSFEKNLWNYINAQVKLLQETQ